MAISVVDTVSSRSSAGGVTSIAQATGGITAGNLVVVLTYAGAASSITLSAPTDDIGTTYNVLNNPTWSATCHSLCMIAWAQPTGTPATITGHVSATSDMAIVVYEISGCSSSPYDVSNNTETASTAAPPTGAITTTQASEILITGVTQDGATSVATAPSGFTIGPKNDDATLEVYASAHQIVSTIQTAFNPTWAYGSARNCDAAIAAFKEGSAGGSPVRPIAMWP